MLLPPGDGRGWGGPGTPGFGPGTAYGGFGTPTLGFGGPGSAGGSDFGYARNPGSFGSSGFGSSVPMQDASGPVHKDMSAGSFGGYNDGRGACSVGGSGLGASLQGSSLNWAGVASGFGSAVDVAPMDDIPSVYSMKSRGGLQETSLDASSLAAPGSSASTTSLGPGALPGQDQSWVTVFGYPGRAAALVQQQLEALCGPIAEVRHGDGNFMHVRFQSVHAAQQCLSHHGHTVLGKLMIGCVPCTSTLLGTADQKAPDSSRRRELVEPEASIPRAPLPQVHRGNLLWRLLDLVFDV